MAPLILVLAVASAAGAALYALDPGGFATGSTATIYVLIALALALRVAASVGRHKLADLRAAEMALRLGKWPGVLAALDTFRAKTAMSPNLASWGWPFTFQGPAKLTRHAQMLEAQAKYELRDLAGARAALAPALSDGQPDWRARLLAARCALEQGERDEAKRLATGDGIPYRLKALAEKLLKDVSASTPTPVTAGSPALGAE
jgi:hypothetical protein